MSKINKYGALAASAATAAAIAGFAVAQVTPVPSNNVPAVANVGPTDLFDDIVGGAPQASSFYATPGQIDAVPGYKFIGGTATVAYTVTTGVSNIFADYTTTITSATITTQTNPADGAHECYTADRATTTVTFTASSGQTIAAAGPTGVSGTAGVPICITYVASKGTWYWSD